jgi:8-oxo-dGTP diphosphatase
MIDSTLCYIEKDGKYLMLLRNKKKVDCNKGKWIGVGGKREPLETVPECLLREVREETGLRLKSWTARAIIAFNSDEWEHERMFLFTADDFEVVSGKGVSEEDAERGRRVLRALETGEVLSGAEGDLKWIPKDEIMDLNLWEGDRLFLKKVAEDEPFFFMRLEYHGDDLVESHVGGESFKERVYEETARVPRGRVSTYGEIAVLAGHPGAARAVGNALHVNPYEGIIPCHRIVNASGLPARDFGFGGPEEQLRLLRAEGVKIVNGKVVF